MSNSDAFAFLKVQIEELKRQAAENRATFAANREQHEANRNQALANRNQALENRNLALANRNLALANREANQKRHEENMEKLADIEREVRTMKLGLVYREAIRTTDLDKAKLGREKRRYLARVKELHAWAHAKTNANGNPLPGAANKKNPLYRAANAHVRSKGGVFASRATGNAKDYIALVKARAAHPDAVRPPEVNDGGGGRKKSGQSPGRGGRRGGGRANTK